MAAKRSGIWTSRRRVPPRRGSIVLELIVMLPVWLIVVGAIVQFGLLIGNRQQVALAARVGAEEASRTPDLATSEGAPVPSNVIWVVRQQLLSSGIEHYRITLEHNLAGGADPITLIFGTDDFPALDPPPPPSPWPDGQYVRVTVYVPADQLAPNVFSFFGFNISKLYIRNAVTFRHEL